MTPCNCEFVIDLYTASYDRYYVRQEMYSSCVEQSVAPLYINLDNLHGAGMFLKLKIVCA